MRSVLLIGHLKIYRRQAILLASRSAIDEQIDISIGLKGSSELNSKQELINCSLFNAMMKCEKRKSVKIRYEINDKITRKSEESSSDDVQLINSI